MRGRRSMRRPASPPEKRRAWGVRDGLLCLPEYALWFPFQREILETGISHAPVRFRVLKRGSGDEGCYQPDCGQFTQIPCNKFSKKQCAFKFIIDLAAHQA